MNKADLISLIKPEYVEDFLKFIHTGEASEEFLEYARNDKNCQKALDLAFYQQVEVFEKLAKLLREVK